MGSRDFYSGYPARPPKGGLLWLLPLVAAVLVTMALVTGSTFWAGEALFIPLAVLATAIGFARTRLFGWQVAIPSFYLLFFGLIPVAESFVGLVDHAGNMRLDRPLIWMSAGLIVFVIAARSVRASPFEPDALGAMPDSSLGKTWFVLTLMLIGGWGFIYSALYGYFGLGGALTTLDPYAGAASVASGFVLLASVVAYSHFMETRRWKWGSIAISATLVSIGVGLFTRSKGAILSPLMIPGLAYFNAKKRIPWLLIAVTAVAYLFVVYPFVTSWRNEGSPEYRSSAEQFQEGTMRLMSWEMFLDGEQGDGVRSLSRGLLTVMGDIVAETGTSTPFEGGSTYWIGFEVMVPRFVWPGKPDMRVGNILGMKYGWIQSSDEITNIAPTLPGEAYVNFGPLGLLVLMAIMGGLAGWMDGPLTARMGKWFLTWSTLAGALGQESMFAHLVMPFARTLLLILMLVGGVDLLLRTTGLAARRREVTVRE